MRPRARRMRTKLNHVIRRAAVDAMLCCGRKKEGRENTPDLATSPRRQVQGQGTNGGNARPKDPPPMVVQGDFRKVSGISNEIFRQIETVENDHDATTAAALEAVERRGEMVVRMLDVRHLGRAAADVDKRYLTLQDSKHSVHVVEIVKRPGQTLGLYIREGNGMDRPDGVFISRIALESAVYNSGCLKVGDEILAVNLVDVTRMSLDDVVIIMSIPRRLVLVTRQPRGGGGSAGMSQVHNRPLEPKPPPVVVIKKELTRDDEPDDDDDENGLGDRRYNISHGRHTDSLRRDLTGSRRLHREEPRDRMQTSRSHLALGVTSLRSSQQSLHDPSDMNNYMLGGGDLYYNSRPPQQQQQHHHQQQGMSLDRRAPHGSNTWSYQPPPPPVITEQPKAQHFQPYDKAYPKTLESLAEKVHSFYPNSNTTPMRRMSATSSTTRLSSLQSQYYSRPNQRVITRSGSDQHLPRVEYDYGSPSTAHRQQTHSLLRSSLKPGTISSYYQSGGGSRTHGMSAGGTLTRRQRTLDYASDTEATCPSSTRSSYYYYRDRPSAAGLSTLPHLSSAATSSITNPGSVTPRGISLRSNSLPRDTRGSRSHHQIPSLAQTTSSRQSSGVRFERDSRSLLDQDDSDGALSAPELPIARRKERDEYRAWLSRAPSTSAIYERIRAGRDSMLRQQKAQRFTFSAENLPERTRQSELLYSSYRPGQLATMGPITTPATSTLDRHQLAQRSTSLRRMRHLLELEAKHLGERQQAAAQRAQEVQADRARVLEINPAEFLKYKMDKPAGVLSSEVAGVSGLLWIHLLAGRGLRSSVTSSSGMRDLYCVLECDRVHKARTVVRTGDLVFDWDETFELDLVSNRELDLLIYSWDPQYRHKLCYKGSVHLASLLRDSPIHQLALKIEPRGTLYLRLRHTDPHHTFLRRSKQLLLPSRSGVTKSLVSGIFGTELETVVNRENLTGGVPGGMATSITMATSTNNLVPIIIRRCVEEIERRGLDIIGLYRLCGSATKKRILREAFERNARTVDLSPDNVPDINVITGVLKDYLRELPEPLFTKCLYQMMVDALTVCLPDDPEGNAKLMFSILDCLPRINRATLIYLMDHLALVVSQSEHNKMSPQNLAVCFGPVLMLQSEGSDKHLDFHQPINALRYLLEIWPVKSVRELLTGSPQPPLRPPKASPMPLPPPLPVKPAGFSLQKGGVVPTPSKGIRKPPPAVPARCTPVVVASPTSDSSPEDVEEPTSEGSVKRTPPRVEPRVTRFQHNGVDQSPGSPRTAPPIPGRNGFPPQQGNGFQHNQTRQIFPSSQPNFSPNLSIDNAKSPPSPSVFGSEKSSPKVSPGSFVNGKNFHEDNPEQMSLAETEELSVETPSSSTGTEEDSRKEVGERGVEADAEASDDEVDNDDISQK